MDHKESVARGAKDTREIVDSFHCTKIAALKVSWRRGQGMMMMMTTSGSNQSKLIQGNSANLGHSVRGATILHRYLIDGGETVGEPVGGEARSGGSDALDGFQGQCYSDSRNSMRTKVLTLKAR